VPDATVTVIVPVHNEADFIPVGLPKLIAAVRAVEADAQLIVVENGSTDGSADRARAVAAGGAEVVELAVADYGEALHEGMRRAKGDWVVTFDIDYFSEAFLRDLRALREDADVVIASKRDPGSQDRRPFARRLATFGFNVLLTTVLGSSVSDTHGIKAFRMAVTAPYLDAVGSRQDLFDTELVVRLERAGARISEVPVIVEELRPARSSLLRRVPRTLAGLWRIRSTLSAEP
jgi:glycosyltransferase AglD